MLSGGCLCGAVRFEIDGELGPIIHCHCSMCRKVSGTAFATNASVHADTIRIISGQELISEYESSPGRVRTFCSRCGSPLFGRERSDPSTRRVRLGTFDTDPGGRPVAHIWVGSKAPWYSISGSLEQFEEEPPASYCAPGPRRRG